MPEKTASLAEAMAQLQTKLPEIRKTEKANVGNYSYTYANLASISAQIMPLLGDLGLSFICKPTFIGDRFVLGYKLLHTSGEFEEGQYPLPVGGTPQAIGSAITYGRRYALCAVTGVSPEDDDDDAAAAQSEAVNRGTAQRSNQRPAPTAQRQRPGQPEGTGRPPLPTETGKMSAAQRGKMHALFNQLGVSDREERLNYTIGAIGREVKSSDELTKDETGKLIDSLERWANQEEPPEDGER